MGEQIRFQFFLLGGLQIKQQAAGVWERVTMPPKRTHALLTLLLLRPQPMARELLADLLLPQRLTPKGRQRVRDLLWLLKKALPTLTIVETREMVHLPDAQRWVDVEAFEAAIAHESLASWRTAIDLYGGDLESWDVRWLEERSNNLQLQYTALLHRVSRTLFRQSQFQDGVRFAQRLVDTEPFDEEALRLLMRYQQMLGQRGAGLTAYARFAKSAEKQLGILPDPATRQLADALEDALPTELITHDVEGDPLKLLISRTQTALEQAEQEKATHYLKRLQAFVRGGRVPSELIANIQLLSVDLAIMQRDMTKARRFLADCAANAPETQLRQAILLQRQTSSDAVPIIKQLLIDPALENNPDLQIRTYLMFANITFEFEGNLQQAVRAVDKAFHLARQHKNYVLQCRTLIIKAKFEFLQQEAEAMEITLQEALALAEMYKLRLARFEIYDWLISLRKTTDDLETALPLAVQNLAFSQEIGIPFYINKARTILGLIYTDICEYAKAIDVLLEARGFFSQRNDYYNTARLDYSISMAMLNCVGYDHREALTYAKSATALMRQSDLTAYLPVLLEGQGLVHFLLGEYDETIGCGDEILQLSEESGNISYHSDGLWLKAAGLHGSGAASSALALTEEMMIAVASNQFDQRARPTRYWLHATVLLANGHHEQADKFLRQAVAQVDAIAERISSPRLRAGYLSEPLTRKVLEAAARHGIAS